MNKFYKVCLIVAGVMIMLGLTLGTAGSVMGGNRQLKEYEGGKAVREVENLFYNIFNWNHGYYRANINDNFDDADSYNYDDDYYDNKDDYYENEYYDNKLDHYYNDEYSTEPYNVLPTEKVQENTVGSAAGTVRESNRHTQYGQHSIVKFKNQTFSGRIDNLNIDVEGGVVYIEEHDEVDFKITVNDARFKAGIDENTLYIKRDERTWNYLDIDKKIATLYIPRNTGFNEVDIDIGAGNAVIKNLLANELDIEVGAGWLKADTLTAVNADIQADAGQIDIKHAEFDMAEVKVGAGNISIGGRIQREIVAQCDVGNITMDLQGSEKEYDYQLSTDMGTIVVEDNKYSALSGKKYIDNGAGTLCVLSCSVGNIDVNFNK